MSTKKFYPTKPRRNNYNFQQLKDDATKRKFEENLTCNFDENDPVETLWSKLRDGYEKNS